MFAYYKDQLFRFSDTKEGYYLVTDIEAKTDPLFTGENGYFACPVKLRNEDLTDVFEVAMYVTYDVHYDSVDPRWKLYGDKDEIVENKVKLYFGLGGSLPGFTQIDKCECQKYVKMEDLEKMEIEIKYKKRNGSICEDVVCSEITMDKFISEHAKYYGKV